MKITMKKFNFLIAVLIVALGVTACSKNDYEPYDYQKYLALEAPIVERYADSVAAALGTVAIEDSTGIWYIVLEPGIQEPAEGNGYYKYNINANSIEAPRVRVNYTGKVIPSGRVFDQNNMKEANYLRLNDVVYAWQAAFLPKYMENEKGELKYNNIGMGILEKGLQKGAKVRIFSPSPYGYANQARSGIPANSPLDFSIEVLEVRVPAVTN